MTKRIFVWVAHPKSGSLCGGIADAYQSGAERGDAAPRRMNLCEMSFDMAASAAFGDARPPLEPDLEAWRENIAWADHLLFVHPYWWGAMPAMAKAVLDRALNSGFGFKYHDGGLGWDKLLTGKSADVILTSDTPPLVDTLIYGKPGRRVMKNQVLGFCGVKTKTVVQFGPVKTANEKKIGKWLRRAEQMGAKAAGSSRTPRMIGSNFVEETR